MNSAIYDAEMAAKNRKMKMLQIRSDIFFCQKQIVDAASEKAELECSICQKEMTILQQSNNLETQERELREASSDFNLAENYLLTIKTDAHAGEPPFPTDTAPAPVAVAAAVAAENSEKPNQPAELTKPEPQPKEAANDEGN